MVKEIVAADVVDQVFVSVSDVDKAVAARKANPQIRVQVRPDDAAQLKSALAKFPARPPEVIELPAGDLEVLAPLAHAGMSRTFTNGWGVDIQQATIGGMVDAYMAFYDQGADIVQSEFPASVLLGLGRAAVD